MKILLLGGGGQLGHELRGPLSSFAEVATRSHEQLDFSDDGALRALVAAERPAVIVNAAAYTDVDGAEKQPDVADRINARAVAILGEEAKRLGAGLIHFSTDFVFDGEKGSPYRESDPVKPLSEYGRSKLAGEKALAELDAPALVFRTAWVYSLRRKSFATTILRLAREKETLQVVTDQVGNPTFCRDLAAAVALVVYGMRADAPAAIRAARGVYHLAGGGAASRFEWAEALLALDPRKDEHKTRSLVPIASDAFPLPARRPRATPLDTSKVRERFGIALPGWREALARALTS